MCEFGIHASAGGGERLESGRSFRAGIDQHPAGGVGGFAAWLSALDDQDGRASPAEGEGEGKADDAPANDDYVPSLHLGIVKEGEAREGHGVGTKMTGRARLHKMACMKKSFVIGVLLALAMAGAAVGQKDKDNEPTSFVYFQVIKDDNGKPVRNAAVIMHAVNEKGKQERGDMELKTDPEGKANFDGIPYGMLRVQVIATGFQTFGEDYDVEKGKTEITIKLKRPQGQYSVYDDHAKDPAPKQDPPPADQKKKPN
jgi:Carboxypeptidase regulatory-like domain